MLTRVVTALVLIPPVLYVIGWGPRWLFALMVLAAILRLLYEYFAISRASGFQPLTVIGYLGAAAFGLTQALAGTEFGKLALSRAGGPWLWSALVCLSLLILILAAALNRVDLRGYLGSCAATLFGALYAATISCLIPLRDGVPGSPLDGRHIVLLLFLILWAGDSLAYFAGRAVGRHKLAPRISPGKTIEGSIGGLLGSVLIAVGLCRWFWHTGEVKTAILIGGVVAVTGQVGDLAESAMKRGAQIKDSSDLLPGHGGLLDRLDSLIFAAPALLLLLTAFDLR
jgi:phosphatidate cytidylyltransferase